MVSGRLDIVSMLNWFGQVVNNNKLSNLRWATAKEQAENSTLALAKSINVYNNNKFIKCYKSISKAKKDLNIATNTLTKYLLSGEIYNGYEFKYADKKPKK